MSININKISTVKIITRNIFLKLFIDLENVI